MTLQNPKVSVVIPVFNKREYIEETIHSVLQQDFQSIEVIVVDDGSTDDSLVVINAIKDSRLRVFSQSNTGVERARNFGFSQSVGTFVVFLDADDLMSSNRLSKQVDLFHTNDDLVLVGTWAKVINNHGKVIGSIHSTRTNAAIQLAHIFRNQFVNSSVMVRRSAIEKGMIFDESHGRRFAEDFELWLRILKKGDAANIPEELTAYRRLPVSRSQCEGRSLLESARDISAVWLHSNTNLFKTTDSARDFVLAINGLDDLSPSQGCNLTSTLKTYDLLVRTILPDGWRKPPHEFRSVVRRHKSHVVIWCLLGKIPTPIQRMTFQLLGSLKSSQFVKDLTATVKLRISKD